MFIYEITADVEESLIADYESFMLDRHIPDVLATGHFLSASFSRRGNRYRIRYKARDKETLDQYLAKHTERLRAGFLEHFPTGVSLSREVWRVLGTKQAKPPA